MMRLWRWLRSLVGTPAPAEEPHEPVIYNKRQDRDVRWFQMQRHLSEQSTHRLRTLSEDLFPDRDQCRKDAS